MQVSSSVYDNAVAVGLLFFFKISIVSNDLVFVSEYPAAKSDKENILCGALTISSSSPNVSKYMLEPTIEIWFCWALHWFSIKKAVRNRELPAQEKEAAQHSLRKTLLESTSTVGTKYAIQKFTWRGARGKSWLSPPHSVFCVQDTEARIAK